MVFATYLLENAILVMSRGGTLAPYFKVPTWVFFCMIARSHHEAYAAFPKQNSSVGGGGGGEWAHLELTEP